MWKYTTKENIQDYLLSSQLINNKTKKESLRLLYILSNTSDKNYSTFRIPKRNGSTRMIDAPNQNLKKVQKRILENILQERKCSISAKGYQKGISIVQNAKEHIGKKIILKLDIQDFFHSIKKSLLYQYAFPNELYPKEIQTLLIKLCTKNGYLPQGAPTSPYLSNLVLRSFDYKIKDYCEEKKISYTRYADDLTFSGDFNPQDIITWIRKQLKPYRLKLNDKKIQILKPHQKQIVTGIVVNEKCNTPRNYRKELRQIAYYIKKYGLKSYNKYQREKNKKEVTWEELFGKINFVLQVSPENKEFQKVKKELIALKNE